MRFVAGKATRPVILPAKDILAGAKQALEVKPAAAKPDAKPQTRPATRPAPTTQPAAAP